MKKKKSISTRQLVIGIFASLLMFTSWYIYKEYFEITQRYTISTTKLKGVEFKIPYIRRNIEVSVYAHDKLCSTYLKSQAIRKDIKFKGNLYPMGEWSRFYLNLNIETKNIKHGDTIELVLSSDKKLKKCNFFISIEDLALNVFFAVVFGYGAVMFFVLSSLILFFRWIIGIGVYHSLSKR